MPEPAHIAVVDDEPEIRETLREYLELHGFRVSVADGGEALRHLVGSEALDLVVLDVRMPGEDGLSLTRFLRDESEAAIVMLTAVDEMVDRVVGLEIGADDYLAKPADPSELHARINAVLRRYKPQIASTDRTGSDARVTAFGDCVLNLDAHLLLDASGNEISITAHEFALLQAFAERPGRVLGRETLFRLVYDREWHPDDRSVDLKVSRLRRKIENNSSLPSVIKTVHGEGYVYSAKT
jgi:two-component system phosphate regulon response regulator OmpR